MRKTTKIAAITALTSAAVRLPGSTHWNTAPGRPGHQPLRTRFLQRERKASPTQTIVVVIAFIPTQRGRQNRGDRNA
jgi:hypothetical protein